MPSYYDRRNVDDHWLGGKQNDVMNGNGGNDYIRGGGGDDRIYGGIGNDQLYGDDGKDFLQGNEGTDLVDGGAGNDTLYGGAGNESVDGGAGNDAIHGDDGNDTMHGGIGDDALNGGVGFDILTGGAGADHFDYGALSDSVGATADRITDYSLAAGDDLVFAGLDANAGVAGLQGWKYVSQLGDYSGDNGQATLSYDAASTTTTLSLYNQDGNQDADFTVLFTGQYGAGQIQITLLDMAGGAPNPNGIIW